jgi:hypothetical protein
MYFPRFVLLVVALATASCGNLVIVQDDPGPRSSYFIGYLDYATRNGAIETIVVGNPFGAAKNEFDKLVVSLMKHQNRGIPAEFVIGQNEKTIPLYKVAVVFNQRTNFPHYDMCKQPGKIPTQPHTGQLRIAIAFCEGDEVKSGTTGFVNNITSGSDPRFAELVQNVTRYMVSEYDYEQDNGDSGPVPP